MTSIHHLGLDVLKMYLHNRNKDCQTLEPHAQKDRAHHRDTVYCSCDLDLDPVTVICELDLHNLKLYQRTNYEAEALQIDREIRPGTLLYHAAHSRVITGTVAAVKLYVRLFLSYLNSLKCSGVRRLHLKLFNVIQVNVIRALWLSARVPECQKLKM